MIAMDSAELFTQAGMERSLTAFCQHLDEDFPGTINAGLRYELVSCDYAGKSVNLRWRFVATENNGAEFGGSLDEIFVGDVKDMPSLAVSEIQKNDVTVYPNPTTDYLYWNGEPATVKVYDLTGKCVKFVADADCVSLADLTAGTYIVTVATDNSVSTVRVIKQ